jgi:hypothetical protein
MRPSSALYNVFLRSNCGLYDDLTIYLLAVCGSYIKLYAIQGALQKLQCHAIYGLLSWYSCQGKEYVEPGIDLVSWYYVHHHYDYILLFGI